MVRGDDGLAARLVRVPGLVPPAYVARMRALAEDAGHDRVVAVLSP